MAKFISRRKRTMADPAVEKVHHGFKIDGVDLIRANCGCGGLTGPGGSGSGDCCMTYSAVKQEGNVYYFVAKYTTPNTVMNIENGYRVKKGNVEVDVHVYDTKGVKNFKYGGAPPPDLVSRFERNIEGTGEPMPEWCSPEACLRPDIGRMSPHGEKKK
jgi:hypothetical protein